VLVQVLVLDERHQVDVVLARDDDDALPGVTVGVRRLRDVEQVPMLDMEDEVLEPDAALFRSFAFFASSQAKYLASGRTTRRVPRRHTLASARTCPKVR
jgi:hypothetical protein